MLDARAPSVRSGQDDGIRWDLMQGRSRRVQPGADYERVCEDFARELVIESGQETVRGGPGEVILIPAGTTVTYRAGAGTKAFFVLHPRDWAERSGE